MKKKMALMSAVLLHSKKQRKAMYCCSTISSTNIASFSELKQQRLEE
jgi:hypothetical protein